MKRKAKSAISILLALMLLSGLLPMTAFAADNEPVLTSVGHSSSLSAVNVAGSLSATLTVPFSYSGAVDLANGLEITYDTSAYVSAVASFPEGSEASVGGEPVSMTVTYRKTGDEATYTSLYSITVVRAAGTAPAFSGTIAKTLDLPGSLTLTAADFTGRYAKNDGGDLSYINITGSHPSFGSLQLGSQAYAFGDKISLSDLEAGKLAFAASGVGTVSYLVRAYALGDANTPIGQVTLTITARLNENAMTLSYTTAKDTPVTMRSADFAGKFTAATGSTLGFVRFTLPPASCGKLYYNYRAAGDYDALVTADTSYYNGTTPDLSRITFVPTAGYTGTVTILYKGYDTGTISTGVDGKLVIAVNSQNPGQIAYTTDEDTPLSLKASDFDEVCRAVTGKALSSVKFTLPAAAGGKLYYNYRAAGDYDALVSAGTSYFADASPHLSDVDFVPASGYAGEITLSYTGYDADGDSYTGQVKITVDEKEDGCHFHDVDKNLSWAKEAIEYLFENDVIRGEKPGYFNPHASIKRGDFILMLCRAFNLKADNKGNFADVEESSYYYDAIATAKSLKIVKGAGGKFNPHAALSREDAMVLIARALEAAGMTISSGDESDLASFTDRDSLSDYAGEPVSALVRARIVQGSAKKLNPKSSISRAEISVLLYRILEMD